MCISIYWKNLGLLKDQQKLLFVHLLEPALVIAIWYYLDMETNADQISSNLNFYQDLTKGSIKDKWLGPQKIF